MKIVGISGSIVGSKTRVTVEKVLNHIKKSEPDADVELIDLKNYQLEFCDGRPFTGYVGDTKLIINKILSADAFIIGTPIFQASIPGTLKNLFDLLPIDAISNKAVGIVSTAGSAKHHLVVEHQLKPILSYMKAMTLPQYVFIEEKYFNEKKEILDEQILSRLKKLADDVVRMNGRIGRMETNSY
ncbi:NAD(P)H-dependent oxidoreductase [Virgibacillus sp. NKC19-16]|uniref:NADPH-dependent FMN reductase n=1 Tax=Virgibacillus salidurans TaxID=2831673 RepID=UPI001F36286D|nr:NAD(P)H-dependent oxidoreductase [Virgibacillus sp. NKC19-16]UJL46294.1 NAD(P)H-dependent oxidoreductase [Virgibacillus sp. NKC19-16]